MNLFEKWAYLGFGAEDLRDHEEAVMRRNCETLRVHGLLFAVLCVLMAGVFFFQRMNSTSITLLAYAAVAFVIGFSGDKASKREDITLRKMQVMLFTFNIAGYLAAIILGTYLSSGQPAVMFIIAMLYFQIDFDMAPYKNFVVTIAMYVLFILSVFLIKDYSIAMLDLQDSTLVLIAGLCVSWLKARTKWENMIMFDRLQKANYSLYHDSVTDVLTGLPNRRQVFDFLNELRDECVEDAKYFTCIIMDLDFFKSYNDTYGHDKGDELLREIGERLNKLALENDISIGRIGGEEFMAFGEQKGRGDAEEIGEKIRVEIMKVHHEEEAVGKRQTASIGIFCEIPDEDFKVADSYRCADHALYKAKEGGRNCCYTYIKEIESYRRVGR
jgi:diguanylate cyclase (GGDEF)-like protein